MSGRALETLVSKAVEATAATAGWALGRSAAGLTLLAYCGPDDPAGYLGASYALAEAGSAGLAASSGQPLAVRPRPGDALVGQGPMALPAVPPTCYVTVPCSDDGGVAGVIEVVDKRGAAAFDIDDVELLCLLGDIAAALLRDHAAATAPDTADPFSRVARDRPAVHRALLDLVAALEGP